MCTRLPSTRSSGVAVDVAIAADVLRLCLAATTPEHGHMSGPFLLDAAVALNRFHERLLPRRPLNGDPAQREAVRVREPMPLK